MLMTKTNENNINLQVKPAMKTQTELKLRSYLLMTTSLYKNKILNSKKMGDMPMRGFVTLKPAAKRGK